MSIALKAMTLAQAELATRHNPRVVFADTNAVAFVLISNGGLG